MMDQPEYFYKHTRFVHELTVIKSKHDDIIRAVKTTHFHFKTLYTCDECNKIKYITNYES